jgi:tetratricopeptide (TPR) repeat protein
MMTRTVQFFIIRREQGRLEELRDAVLSIDESNPEIPYFGCLISLLELEAGRREVATERFERLASGAFTDLPQNILWHGTVALLAEIAAKLEDVTTMIHLDELLTPYGDRHVLGINSVYHGCTTYFRGLMALSCGQTDVARTLLEQAESRSRAIDAWPNVARTAYARAQLAASEGDLARARDYLSEALALARRLAMTRLAGECDDLARVLG